ncbi:ROK family protein [Marinilabiliaceae bacterium JC017]|nr:ROK family protein [Marinilabiliaceae bacterium JC017]
MNRKSAIIGVDLGGTNMRAGRVVNGEIVKKASRLVPKTDRAEVVLDDLMATISEVFEPDTQAIGVGVPSLVKPEEGIVYNVQNIPSWEKVYLKDRLQSYFKVPVFITNDANCFAIGERVFGQGRQYKDFVGLITGTGLGGGIVKNGHILSDQNCGAGEFGMIPYLDYNYEFYCSGQFFNHFYNQDGGVMAKQASLGDETALKAFREYGSHLGKAIKVILYAVDPEVIILGGSVSKSFRFYQAAMWEELRSFPYSVTLENIKVLPSDMQEIAILGAAALCIDAAELVTNN